MVKITNVLNRLTVANPTPRDDMVREATIRCGHAKRNGTAMDMDDDDDGASSQRKHKKISCGNKVDLVCTCKIYVNIGN